MGLGPFYAKYKKELEEGENFPKIFAAAFAKKMYSVNGGKPKFAVDSPLTEENYDGNMKIKEPIKNKIYELKRIPVLHPGNHYELFIAASLSTSIYIDAPYCKMNRLGTIDGEMLFKNLRKPYFKLDWIGVKEK